ncbi:MAG: SpaA isopeptide-forming pilin-related protein [Candidatus Woykebacteria bacterium]
MKKLNKVVKKVLAGATSVALLSGSLLPITFALATPVHAAPNIELTNVVDKAVADRGDLLNYTLTIKNTGTADLTTVFLWINEPNLADYINGSTTYTRTSTGITRSLTDAWIRDGVNFGTVLSGTNVILKYQTRVAQNANNDNIIWSAVSVTSDQTARVQKNSQTKVFLRNPSICAAKKADKSTVSPGDTVTYTIELCNNGNMVLNNVRVFDVLPSEVTYIKGSTTYDRGNFHTNITDAWIKDGLNVGDLDTVNKGLLKFKVKVKSDVKDGTEIRNAARIKSDQTPVWIECDNKIKVEVKKGAPERGHLKIFKFEDSNGDKTFNDGERSLPGFKFRISGEGIEKTVTTEGDGVVIIRDLEPGTYRVSEIVPAGWRITTDNNVKVEVKAKELSEVRFGNKQVGKVLSKIKELPNTGPGALLLLLGGIAPAGVFLRRLKRKI